MCSDYWKRKSFHLETLLISTLTDGKKVGASGSDISTGDVSIENQILLHNVSVTLHV